MKRGHITFADIILTAALLFAAAVGIVVPIVRGVTSGSEAVIRVDGEVWRTVSLGDDSEIDIDGHNFLIIQGGAAHMESADCPDKLCVHQGEISRPGERIVCLPNRVSVAIE